jgi:autotransporter-associated beta strand protein
MKTLRHNRILLGWFMTALVFCLQVATPLRAATLYWAPVGTATNDSGSFYYWETTTNNWWDNDTFTDPAGLSNNGLWVNGNTAFFGNGSSAPFSVELAAPITVDGITLKYDFGTTTLKSQSAAQTLTFSGPTANINLEGSSATTLVLTAALAGNNLNVQSTGTGAGTLVLDNRDNLTFPNSFYANNLTGSITVNNNTTLDARVYSGGVNEPLNNSLGGAAVVLAEGAKFKITGDSNTLTGISGREFILPAATSNTSRIDFNGEASRTRTDGLAAEGLNISIAGTPAPPPTGIQWLGKMQISSPGLYSFNSQSDDGSRLFIDGVMVVNNDGGKGSTALFSAPIQLAAGLHDIRVDYVNGSGGGAMALTFSQSFDGGVSWNSPSNLTSMLTQAEVNTIAEGSSALQLGNNVSLAGNAEIILDNVSGNFASAKLGGLTINNDKTLTVTSKDFGNPITGNGDGFGRTLRFGGASVLGNTGASGTVTIASSANVSFDGTVSDGGRDKTLVKTGTGRLYFSQTAVANSLRSSSKVEMQEGNLVLVGSTAAGANNPIGSAEVVLNGGGLVLDSKGATISGVGPVFNNQVTLQENATIQSVVNNARTVLGGPSNGIAIGTHTLTLDAISGGRPVGDPGATLVVAGGITGTGSLFLTSTLMNFASTGSASATVDLFGVPTSQAWGFASAPGTIVLRGTTTFAGSVTLINGVGLQLESTQVLTNKALTLSGNALSLMSDGNGGSGFEALSFNNQVTMNASGTINVGRANSITPLYFAQAANKTAQISSLALGATTPALTVANNNGYGLEVTGNTTFGTATTITVNSASASNLTSGLKLSGVVSGAVGLTKAGGGVLELTNPNNSSFGTGVINVTAGVLAASSNGALGNFTGINLNGANATFRATGDTDYTLSKNLTLTNAATILEVTGGKVVTVSGALTFPNAANNFSKVNTGTLLLTQAQSGWDGIATVTQGALRISNANALGTGRGTTTIANVGAALELNNVNVAGETLIFSPGNNNTSSGINSGGALRAVSGANTWGGAINFSGVSGTDNQHRSAVIGVAGGGTSLTISGVITGQVGTAGTGRGNWIGLNADAGGTGTISTALQFTGSLSPTGGTSSNTFALAKVGAGTWNLTAANVFPGQNVFVNGGMLSLNGAGTLGVPGAGGGVGTVFVTVGGTLALDNNGTNTATRLSNRTLNLYGGTINFTGLNNATSSETTTGTLTFNAGQSNITVTATGASGQASFTTGAVTRVTGATAFITGSNLGNSSAAGVATIQASGTGYAFIGQNGAVGAASKGVVPWAVVNATPGSGGMVTSFATADAVTGRLRALAAGEAVSSFSNSIAGVITPLNVSLTAGNSLTTSMTVNSLTLGSGGGATISPLQALTIDSGGILALTGNNGITGGFLTTTGNRELIVHALANTTISSTIQGTTGGLTKAGAGILTLSSPAYYSGLTTVNQGTLRTSGGAGTIFFNNDFMLQGGSLDLNGTAQVLNRLRTDTSTPQNANLIPGAGGSVTNSSGTRATLGLANAGVSFSGSITGNLALVRSVAAGNYNDWNIYSVNSYTGATILNGGRTQLLGTATLGSTSSIEISQATLRLSNNNATSILDINDNNRIPETAPIAMRGGMLQYFARNAMEGTETVGAVTLSGGTSVIEVAAPGTNINSSVLTLGSLTQAATSRSTLRIFGVAGNMGSTGRILITSAPVLTNNIIGGWAVMEREFASYTPIAGLGALNGVGYAGYAPTAINGTGLLTLDNVRLSTAGGTALTSGVDINSLAMVVAGDTTLNLGGNTLTLRSGGLIASNANDNSAITISNGSLTSGVSGIDSDLYLHAIGYVNGNGDVINRDVIVSANIMDNGIGDVTLVINGTEGRATAGFGTNEVILTGNNTYTGGTYVNAGRVLLNSVTNNAFGTGNVFITGGGSTNGNTFQERTTTVQLGAANQINTGSIVTLFGGAVLDLNHFTQTLGGLVFNNTGGHTPTLSTGTGTLTLNGNITATSSNLGSISTLSSTFGGGVNLGGGIRTLTVNPLR